MEYYGNYISGKVNAVECKHCCCHAEEHRREIIGNREQSYLEVLSKFKEIVSATDCFEESVRDSC